MKKKLVSVIAAAAAMTLLVSCQQLFTTSLGKSLARDSYDLSGISLAEALDYLAQARTNGDVRLATALVTPLFSKASTSTVGTTAYDQAATALVSAVIVSSGIGQAINTGLGLIASSITDGEEITLSEVAEIIESVSISEASVNALLLVAENPPPSMDATQAYTAAATLLLHVVESTSLTLESDNADFVALTGPAADAFSAAQALFDHATDNLNGADTVFGDFFGALPFSAS